MNTKTDKIEKLSKTLLFPPSAHNQYVNKNLQKHYRSKSNMYVLCILHVYCMYIVCIMYFLNLKVNAKILAWLLREAFNISLNIVISSKMK